MAVDRRNETLYSPYPVEGGEGSWVSLAILRALGARDPGSNPGEPIFTTNNVRSSKWVDRLNPTRHAQRNEHVGFRFESGRTHTILRTK